jgi:hypothetical protein
MNYLPRTMRKRVMRSEELSQTTHENKMSDDNGTGRTIEESEKLPFEPTRAAVGDGLGAESNHP